MNPETTIFLCVAAWIVFCGWLFIKLGNSVPKP